MSINTDNSPDQAEGDFGSQAQEYTSNRKTASVPLDIASMPGKESSWSIDDHGHVIIPTPISVFPKPLALAYRNLYNHWKDYRFRTVSRNTVYCPKVLVASRLVVSLLENYFPAPGYRFSPLHNHPYNLVANTPELGTQPFVVLRDDEPVGAMAEGEATAKSDSRAEIHLIFIAMNHPDFIRLPGRTQPSRVAISPECLQSDGTLNFAEMTTSRCTVIILTETGAPSKPSFEFYSFNASRDPSGLIPWFGKLHKEPTADSHDTNIVSLAMDNVDIVDKMFKAIVRSSSDNHLVTSFQAADANSQV